MIDFLFEVWADRLDKAAIVSDQGVASFADLRKRITLIEEMLHKAGLPGGTVVGLHADFSPDAIAAFLALTNSSMIIIPMSSSSPARHELMYEIAQIEWLLDTRGTSPVLSPLSPGRAQHDHYQELRSRKTPGLVLFTSGSSGAPKGAVHDLAKLLDKFRMRRRDFVTLAFLLLDHIGGIDTLLYVLSNGSTLVTTHNRDPEHVAVIIEKHHVEVLPVTPTFLNLLLLSEAYLRHDLSSLRVITYGSEVMPQTTLKRCAELFPAVTLLQKYGTTEIGTLRSQSESQDSTWVKIGGEGYQLRVVDGLLEIKAHSAILGYLNAPSPFTADGWFITGDMVEQKGEFIRFLGRQSDVINVGGRKVFPSEVEQILLLDENVAEAVAYGERNAVFGMIVAARVRLRQTEEIDLVRRRLRDLCRQRLEAYKVPVRIEITDTIVHSSRLKTVRPSDKPSGGV